MDSAWIFRICLFMGILLIVFADFLVARKDDGEREDSERGADKSTENNFNKKGNLNEFNKLFPCSAFNKIV